MADYTSIFDQLQSQFRGDTDTYVNDLISQAQGDTDFAIKQLKREHDLAVGNNDSQTAQFLESVADKLEEKVGRIPYDYQVATTREEENFARTMDIAGRQKKTALDRLSEDERVWKEEKKIADTEAKTSQQEALLKRGILSGTREGAEGLAGSEVKKMDVDLQKQLEAYDRALGRQKGDIGTEFADVSFAAGRTRERNLADLKTGARRGVVDTQDKFQFGSEAQRRALDAEKKKLERLRQEGYQTAPTYAATRVTQMYG